MSKIGGSHTELPGNFMETRNPYENPDLQLKATIQSIADKTGLTYRAVQVVLIEHFNVYIENIYDALNLE